MSGVRQVVCLEEFQLDPRKDFDMDLPRQFVDHEADADRILDSWQSFLKVTNKLLRSRRSLIMMTGNKHWKRAAFNMGMEKICIDFSRRTENIKLEFYHHKNKNEKTKFKLRIFKLSNVPEHYRNARCIVAEIPEREMEVHAELVVTDNVVNDSRQTQGTQDDIDNSDQLHQQPIVEVLSVSGVPSNVLSSWRQRRNNNCLIVLEEDGEIGGVEQQAQLLGPMDVSASAPIASEVVAII